MHTSTYARRQTKKKNIMHEEMTPRTSSSQQINNK